MPKIPMTQRGYKQLAQELSRLKSTDRPDVIAAIADARRHGDLSENAEYAAAKEKQRVIERRISELEQKIADADVVHVRAPADNSVVFGACVTLFDEASERELSYQIIGEDEADIKNGFLSIESPLARGLLGKKQGESIEITSPGGTKEYEILNISYDVDESKAAPVSG